MPAREPTPLEVHKALADDTRCRPHRSLRLSGRPLAEILAGLLPGQRSRDRAQELAREWGEYLVVQGGPKPGTRLPARRNLAILQEAVARAGFDPMVHRRPRP